MQYNRYGDSYVVWYLQKYLSHHNSYAAGLAKSVETGALCTMRHWVVVLLLVCVVSLHLHGDLGKRKPNIIIFFVDDVSERLSNDSTSAVI